MTRVLNPHPEGGRYWAMAFVMSAAVHAAAAVYMLDVIPFRTPDDAPPVSFPDIAISNTVLEQQQLAPLEPDAAEPPEPDTPEPEAPEEPAAEELAPAEAEAVDEAEAEELAPAEAEELAAAEAEELAPAEAEELAPAETEELVALEPEDSETLEPVAPEAEAAAAPEQLNPILPDTPAAETVAPTAPSPRLAPIAPADGTAIQGAVVQPVQPAAVAAAPVVTSVQPVTRVAPVAPPPRPTAPPTPTPAAAPPPSPEDLAVLELIERIQNRFGDECLIALPQNQGPGLNPLVTLISDQERSISTFVEEVLSDSDLPVDDRRILIDNRQCPALDYARAHRNYPAFRVDLTLQSRIVASGNNLVGRLSGFGGRYTSLLAVDSNGVVTDLRRFTQFRQGTAVLDAPVNINAAARDTSQLLIAIATPGLPTTVTQRAGWLAQDFFPLLGKETEGQAVIGILPFDVR